MAFDNHFCSPPVKSLFPAENPARGFLPASNKTPSITCFYCTFTVVTRRWTKLLLHQQLKQRQDFGGLDVTAPDLVSFSLPEKHQAPSPHALLSHPDIVGVFFPFHDGKPGPTTFGCCQASRTPEYSTPWFSKELLCLRAWLGFEEHMQESTRSCPSERRSPSGDLVSPNGTAQTRWAKWETIQVRLPLGIHVDVADDSF